MYRIQVLLISHQHHHHHRIHSSVLFQQHDYPKATDMPHPIVNCLLFYFGKFMSNVWRCFDRLNFFTSSTVVKCLSIYLCTPMIIISPSPSVVQVSHCIVRRSTKSLLFSAIVGWNGLQSVIQSVSQLQNRRRMRTPRVLYYGGGWGSGNQLIVEPYCGHWNVSRWVLIYCVGGTMTALPTEVERRCADRQ